MIKVYVEGEISHKIYVTQFRGGIAFSVRNNNQWDVFAKIEDHNLIPIKTKFEIKYFPENKTYVNFPLIGVAIIKATIPFSILETEGITENIFIVNGWGSD